MGRLEGVHYKMAEKKYKEDFKLTDEERVKQGCNEILNKLGLGVHNGKVSIENGVDEEKNVNPDDTCFDQDEFDLSEIDLLCD